MLSTHTTDKMLIQCTNKLWQESHDHLNRFRKKPMYSLMIKGWNKLGVEKTYPYILMTRYDNLYLTSYLMEED